MTATAPSRAPSRVPHLRARRADVAATAVTSAGPAGTLGPPTVTGPTPDAVTRAEARHG